MSAKFLYNVHFRLEVLQYVKKSSSGAMCTEDSASILKTSFIGPQSQSGRRASRQGRLRLGTVTILHTISL